MTSRKILEVDAQIAVTRESEERLLSLVDGINDKSVLGATLCTGWTRAHLLAHLARNADSHTRRAKAAFKGEVVDQYPGGLPAREAEIEAGSKLRVKDLVDDLKTSSEAMFEAWSRVKGDLWKSRSRDVSGRVRKLSELPARRWFEAQIHAVDLDMGLGFEDLSDEFVEHFLRPLRSEVRQKHRLPVGVAYPELGTLSEREEIAWIIGRLDKDDLPTLRPWS